MNLIQSGQLSSILLKLTSNQSLTAEESHKAFSLIGDYDSEGLFFTALLSGLMSKGISIDEILGFCMDRKDRTGTIEISGSSNNIIDLSGGGGDRIKSVNVSTLASLICASGGLKVAKQSAAAFTGFLGSSDILMDMGILIPQKGNVKKNIKRILEKTNFVAYNYVSLAPKSFENYLSWRKKIVESGMKIFIPQHIASFAYSPIVMANRIYGLADSKYMVLLAKVLKRLGHKNILVVHGLDGLDEISNIGKTKIVEIRNGKLTEYELTPEDFGVKKAKIVDIRVQDKAESKKEFENILFGDGKRAIKELVAINAGAAFYISGRKGSFKEGTEFAMKLLESGEVKKKFNEILSVYKTL